LPRAIKERILSVNSFISLYFSFWWWPTVSIPAVRSFAEHGQVCIV